MLDTDDDFLLTERKRKKIFAVIGIALIFSLVSTSAYSANNIFTNLGNEIELMKTDVHDLQNNLNNTYVELNQTRSDLGYSIEKSRTLHDKLNTSIEEKTILQNTLNLTRIELLESMDKLKLTSPPTTVSKINQSGLLTLIDEKFNL